VNGGGIGDALVALPDSSVDTAAVLVAPLPGVAGVAGVACDRVRSGVSGRWQPTSTASVATRAGAEIDRDARCTERW